jgi:hypothetical protein
MIPKRTKRLEPRERCTSRWEEKRMGLIITRKKREEGREKRESRLNPPSGRN